MSNPDVHGPIDFVLIEFPGDHTIGAAANALLDIADRGIIRVYDLLLVRKDEDGTFAGIDVADISAEGVGGFTAFAGARSGLLDDEDLRKASDAMEPGTVAALLVYENSWAIPLVSAAHDAGGVVIASQRIPAQDVMDALDALEAIN